MDGKEGKTYSQVIQIKRYYSDGSLNNNRHPSVVVNYIYHLNNEAQSKAYANFSISVTIET